jgi:hypothetical protein
MACRSLSESGAMLSSLRTSGWSVSVAAAFIARTAVRREHGRLSQPSARNLKSGLEFSAERGGWEATMEATVLAASVLVIAGAILVHAERA